MRLPRSRAELVKEVVSYPRELQFDTSRPDGMPLKALDSNQLIAMGWKAVTPFREALSATFEGFLQT